MARKILVLLVLFICFTTLAPSFAQSQFQVFTTAQRFEGGLMLWRSDTGLIWVLADNGQAYSYSASAYSPLPDNPYFQPPTNRYRPINGFGKVWGANSTIRTLLGWATLPEIGFNMPITTLTDGTSYLTQLNGKIYEVKSTTWQSVTAIPNLSAKIVSFAVTPTSAKLGDSFTVTWEVSGSQFVILEVYDTDPNKPMQYFLYDLPLKGSTTLKVPLDTTGDVKVMVWAANIAHFFSSMSLYERVIHTSATISVQKTPTTVQAAFQQYQKGFLLWRGDTGAVMVFYNNGALGGYPQFTYQSLPVPVMTIPAGFVKPVNAFALVWGNMFDVQQALGYATGAEKGYQLSISGANFTLPDGRIAKTTTSGWSF